MFDMHEGGISKYSHELYLKRVKNALRLELIGDSNAQILIFLINFNFSLKIERLFQKIGILLFGCFDSESKISAL